MFPFFRRKRSKWEIARDTVLDYVHDALEHVPVDKLDHLKENLSDAASPVGTKVSQGATHALKAAGGALHVAASTAGGVKEHLVEAATGAAISGAKTAAVGAKHAHEVKETLAEKASEKSAAASAAAAALLKQARNKVVHEPTTAEKLKHSAQNVASHVQETTSHVAETAQQAAQHTASTVHDSAATAQQSLLASLSTLAGIFTQHKEHAADYAHEQADAVRERAQSTRERAAELHEDVVDKKDKAAKQAAKAAKNAAKALKAKREAAPEVEVKEIKVREPEVVVTETSSKFLWFAVGLFAGAILAILLAPTSGRRTRALVKDKVNQAGHEAADLAQAASQRAADLGRKAGGAVQAAKNAGADDDADDVTVADRVRTALGDSHETRELPHLNIDSADGVVTLRGPILDEAQIKAVETVVRAVKGVKEVKTEITVDTAEDEATFVG
jgi:gas vesicle protein